MEKKTIWDLDRVSVEGFKRSAKMKLTVVLDNVRSLNNIGAIFRTCDAFAAGYDLSTPEGYEKTWKNFDDIIGFRYLSGMHLNDTKKGLGSKVDRHESLGKGMLGSEFFRLLAADSRMNDIPLILETPDEEIWGEEIAWLYSLPQE